MRIAVTAVIVVVVSSSSPLKYITPKYSTFSSYHIFHEIELQFIVNCVEK